MGVGNREAVFIVLAVLAVVALCVVVPFSKMWNSDMRMLERRKAKEC